MTFSGLVNTLVNFINTLLPVAAGIAVLFFMWAGVRYISKSGDSHDAGEAKSALAWGVLALFVLFSIWGILALFKGAFGFQ